MTDRIAMLISGWFGWLLAVGAGTWARWRGGIGMRTGDYAGAAPWHLGARAA
jgi:hypothetical protein